MLETGCAVRDASLVPFGPVPPPPAGQRTRALRKAPTPPIASSATEIASPITPPAAASHYYVLVDAPGSAGATIDLSLESLNHAGHAHANKGFLFPPVRAVAPKPSSSASATRPSCDPPYRVDERGVRVFRTECL